MKNPIANAGLAFIYIVLISSLFFYGPKYMPTGEDTILAPIAMLSLFVLSTAVMGFLFISQPLQMYLDGDKKSALKLFLQTMLVFAIIVLIIFVLLIAGFIK